MNIVIHSFEWDDANVEHIVAHGVAPEDVEEIFLSDIYLRRVNEERYIAYGRTEAGRYLMVVFASRAGRTIRPITSRPLRKNEVRTYKRHGKE